MRFLPRSSVVIGTLLSAFLVPLVASATLARSGDAKVGFVAIGPGGLKIEGSTSDLNVADDGSTVTVVVPLANLATGIGLRDRHMKEKYLEVDKYPEAKLAVPRSALQVPASGANASADAQGQLTLHGQTKAVTFHYAASRSSGGPFDVSGAVHLDMRDFGIETPSYLGVKVKPEVDVNVKFQANDG